MCQKKKKDVNWSFGIPHGCIGLFSQQYYNQPPPLMNPSQYNITMTSEFDPFVDYREGPSGREPSVERELPLYGDDDDDVFI